MTYNILLILYVFICIQKEFIVSLCEMLPTTDLPVEYIEEIENDLADTLNQTVLHILLAVVVFYKFDYI